MLFGELGCSLNWEHSEAIHNERDVSLYTIDRKQHFGGNTIQRPRLLRGVSWTSIGSCYHIIIRINCKWFEHSPYRIISSKTKTMILFSPQERLHFGRYLISSSNIRVVWHMRYGTWVWPDPPPPPPPVLNNNQLVYLPYTGLVTGVASLPAAMISTPWTSWQIRKIAGCACTGNAGTVFPATTR